jgi:hypothetical protein
VKPGEADGEDGQTCAGFRHGFDYRGIETKAISLLVPAANHVLGCPKMARSASWM